MEVRTITDEIEENIKKDIHIINCVLSDFRDKYKECQEESEEKQDFIDYFIESYYIDNLNELKIYYNDVIDRLTMNINYNISVFEHYKYDIQNIIKAYFDEEEYSYIKEYDGENSYKY